MEISFIGAGNVAKSLGTLMENINYSVHYGTRDPKGSEIPIQDAIRKSQIIILAIPYDAVEELVLKNKDELKGKIIVDATNPINIENWQPYFMGESSAGEKLAELLPESNVVKAFNSIFATIMDGEKQKFNNTKVTAFIASSSEDSALTVKKIADDIGFNGFIVSDLKNSRYLEAIANLNIAIALSGGGTDAGFVYYQRNENE